MSTIEKIREVIEKEMPALVGVEFKQILTEWEDLKTQNPILKDKVAELLAFKNKFECANNEMNKRETNVLEREKEVFKKEQTHELILIKTINDNLAGNNERLFNLVDKVFGNAKLFEVTTKSTSHSGYTDPSGRYIYGQVETTTETTEKDSNK